MNFNHLYSVFFASLFILLTACSDAENETNLVELHTTASQDIIGIEFPADTETTVSINSEFDFTLLGLKSNGVDLVTITHDIEWSVSQGSISTIDQTGHFTAGSSAEMITVTAKFGFLTESINIRVSSAKFDQVVQLDEQGFSINMCQSQTIEPVGRYIDENGNEEIRPVDSTIINTIEWIVRNEEDESLSQRAFIQTTNNQAAIHTLAAGDIIVQAKALSLINDSEVTSIDFNQTISNGLNSIKLCRSSDEDLNSCKVSSPHIEKDKVLSLIAVGNYQATDGSNYYQNISRYSKWGVSNTLNASIALSSDHQQLNITGKEELSTTSLSVACGDIQQSIVGIDVSQGVVLDSPVSCAVDSLNCEEASTLISIDQLSVLSLDVSANDITLTHDESLNLDTRPDEISLIVEANLSNNTQPDITSDDDLIYTIIPIDGQADVIEKKTDSPGVFTVLGAGTAKIQLKFRDETFIVIIVLP